MGYSILMVFYSRGLVLIFVIKGMQGVARF